MYHCWGVVIRITEVLCPLLQPIREPCFALSALFMGCQGGNWAKQIQLLLAHPSRPIGLRSVTTVMLSCHTDSLRSSLLRQRSRRCSHWSRVIRFLPPQLATELLQLATGLITQSEAWAESDHHLLLRGINHRSLNFAVYAKKAYS